MLKKWKFTIYFEGRTGGLMHGLEWIRLWRGWEGNQLWSLCSTELPEKQTVEERRSFNLVDSKESEGSLEQPGGGSLVMEWELRQILVKEAKNLVSGLGNE